MSAPVEIRNIEQVIVEPAQEMEREAKVAALEVAKVLVELPKSPRKLRLNPTPTKETMKDMKGKQPAILVHAFPRGNPPKPTTQDKGKAINLEPEEEDIEDILMNDEDVGAKVE